MKNKKLIIIIVVVFLYIGSIVGIYSLKNKSEDDKAKEKITAVAKNFYEETYYLTSNKDILKTFNEIGIKISLEELIEFEEKPNNYYEYDTSKSFITIYPQKPYEKEDYIIKISLKRK